MKGNIKRWAIVFRALANANRLQIIKFLENDRRMAVSDIAEALDISIASTSNHLAILKNLDVVDDQGKDAHVYYRLSHELPKDFQKIISCML